MSRTTLKPHAFIADPVTSPTSLAASWIAKRYRRPPATAAVLAELAQLGGLATRGR